MNTTNDSKFQTSSLPTQTNKAQSWAGLSEESSLRLVAEPELKPRHRQFVSPKLASQAKEAKPATPARPFAVFVLLAALTVFTYFLVSRYVVTAVVVQGRSMTPTLKDGERYFLNRWLYLLKAPQRGDVVVIKDPGHADFAVKRIVAGPNDRLHFKDGTIYLNDAKLEESYLATGTATALPNLIEKWVQVGPDQYYVMGDNRANSEDSRAYGQVKRGQILGLICK